MNNLTEFPGANSAAAVHHNPCEPPGHISQTHRVPEQAVEGHTLLGDANQGGPPNKMNELGGLIWLAIQRANSTGTPRRGSRKHGPKVSRRRVPNLAGIGLTKLGCRHENGCHRHHLMGWSRVTRSQSWARRAWAGSAPHRSAPPCRMLPAAPTLVEVRAL